MSRAFDISLAFYRKTIKRFRPLHVAVHGVMTAGVIPLLERGQRFRTMPDDPFWFRLELLTNRHERATTTQLDRLVQPGMTVLDIGAHVGYYARRWSKLVGPEGRVVAFEPHPRTFAVLEHNLGHLANVTLLPLAVAEEEGTAELYDYLMMSASGSLHYDEAMLALQKAQVSGGDIAPRITTDFPIRTYSVRTTPVDTCLADLGIARVDVVKMDIEGAEMSALRGMRKTIANSPGMVMVMEYNPQALQSFGFEPQQALAEVLGMGFERVRAIAEDGTLTDLTGDDAALHRLTAQLMANMGVTNLLFA
ncbi:MAG: FkbM family methyltransferase [Chloroflexi bacterium]|nr:FkbM family methyltransferase [Chloroflexota bacterium]